MFWPVSNLNGVEKLSKEMHFSSGPLLGVIIPEMHPVPPPCASDEPHLSWVKSGARWGDEDEATRQWRMKWADCPAWILIAICHPLVSALWWHGAHYAAHKPDDLLSSELSYWHFLTRGASLGLLATGALMLLRIWVLGVLQMHSKLSGYDGWGGVSSDSLNSCKQY